MPRELRTQIASPGKLTLRPIVILSVLLLLCAPASAINLYGETYDETLKKLPGVWVTVGVDDRENVLTKLGLSPDLMRTDAELRLRMVGIPVLDPKELYEILNARKKRAYGGVPTLCIYVHIMKTQKVLYSNLYVASTELQLFQSARVEQTNTYTSLPTWSRSYLLYGTENRIAYGTRDAIKELADQFANAFLTANPKK